MPNKIVNNLVFAGEPHPPAACTLGLEVRDD